MKNKFIITLLLIVFNISSHQLVSASFDSMSATIPTASITPDVKGSPLSEDQEGVPIEAKSEKEKESGHGLLFYLIWAVVIVVILLFIVISLS